MNRRSGMTLIEMLVAMAILGIVFAILAAFMVQQTRAVALSQAINEAEVTARVIAEAVAQDFQLAGSRAVRVGNSVNYEVIEAGGCDDNNRDRCVLPTSVTSSGAVSEAGTETINGYAIFYRTSLDEADPNCRRVDYAFVNDAVYRSDVRCSSAVSDFDLDVSLFATDVLAFSVRFECGIDTSAGGDPTDDPADDPTDGPTDDPTKCYEGDDDFVRQAFVTVRVRSPGRVAAEGEMTLGALTPNLRPSVSYVDP